MIKKGQEVCWSNPTESSGGAGIIETVHKDKTITIEAGTHYPSVRVPVSWVVRENKCDS